MNKKEFINYLIEVGEINSKVIDLSMEVSDFPLARKLLLKIEGFIENILNPKNSAELDLAKGELLKNCILNSDEFKQEGIKFVDEIVDAIKLKYSFNNLNKTDENDESNDLDDDMAVLLKEVNADPELNRFISEGETHFASKEYESAIESFSSAIKKYDDYQLEEGNVYFMRGLSKWYSKERYPKLEILNDLEKAVLITNKSDPEYLLTLGDYKSSVGNDSIEEYEQLKNFSGYENIFFERGYEIHDYNYIEAKKNYLISISINEEKIAYSYYNLGLLHNLYDKDWVWDDTYLLRIKDFEKSKECFTKAIELDNTNPIFFIERGYLYYNNREEFYVAGEAKSNFQTYEFLEFSIKDLKTALKFDIKNEDNKNQCIKILEIAKNLLKERFRKNNMKYTFWGEKIDGDSWEDDFCEYYNNL